MPPSTIDKIICSIAIFKCELIDRLRTIMKRWDQWMPKVITKGPAGLSAMATPIPPYCLSLCISFAPKRKIIMILILYH